MQSPDSGHVSRGHGRESDGLTCGQVGGQPSQCRDAFSASNVSRDSCWQSPWPAPSPGQSQPHCSRRRRSTRRILLSWRSAGDPRISRFRGQPVRRPSADNAGHAQSGEGALERSCSAKAGRGRAASRSRRTLTFRARIASRRRGSPTTAPAHRTRGWIQAVPGGGPTRRAPAGARPGPGTTRTGPAAGSYEGCEGLPDSEVSIRFASAVSSIAFAEDSSPSSDRFHSQPPTGRNQDQPRSSGSREEVHPGSPLVQE